MYKNNLLENFIEVVQDVFYDDNQDNAKNEIAGLLCSLLSPGCSDVCNCDVCPVKNGKSLEKFIEEHPEQWEIGHGGSR